MTHAPIASFAIFSRLLLAARLGANDPDPAHRRTSLASLMADPFALRRTIRTVGLASLAAEIETRTTQIDRHLTHEGWAKDDARRMFWQAAPLALADPTPLAESPLDPEIVAQALAATVRDGPIGRDFAQAVFAEDYFLTLMTGALTIMRGEIAAIDGVAPALWRRTLLREGLAPEPGQ